MEVDELMDELMDDIAEIWEEEGGAIKEEESHIFTAPLLVDLKLKSVEIDSETADNIVVASMIDQYYNLKKEIEWLKTIKTPLKYQKEDLEDNEKLLDAVVAIIKHYAVHSKWPEELQYKEEMS